MKIFDKLLGGNTLFYPGCMIKFVLKDIQKNYEQILRKSGIDFIKLKDVENCCGSPVLNAGYMNDFKAVAEKNYSLMKKHGVKKIITPCPACFKTFKKDYPEILEKFDIEIEHITQTIYQAIKNKKLKPKIKRGFKAVYHDPCHLGRHAGVYEEPREILKMIGFDLVELKFNKENSLCCGGGGGLKSNYSELSEKITEDVVNEIKKLKVDFFVTTCPMCNACFEQAFKNSKIKVVELSELLC